MTFAEPKKQQLVSRPFTGAVARGQQGDGYREKAKGEITPARSGASVGTIPQPQMMG